MGRPDAEKGRDEFLAWAQDHQHRLFRQAMLLTGGAWHQAEDLTQDTLAAVYRHWGTPLDNPGGYARTVLTRAFLSNRRRKSSTEVPLPDGYDAEADGRDPTSRMVLMDALRTLDEKTRAVVVLRFFGDRSVQDVAAELGMTQTAVRSRSHRAMERLKRELHIKGVGHV